MDTSRFVKEMPQGAKVLRKLTGKVERMNKRNTLIILSARGGDDTKANLPTALLMKHGITEKGQSLEYTFLKIGNERKILLRPFEKKAKKR